MKKRLSIFALIVGLIVTLNAVAWADVSKITLSGSFAAQNQYVTVGSSVTITATPTGAASDQDVYWGIGTTPAPSGTVTNTATINGLTLTGPTAKSTGTATATLTLSGTPTGTGKQTFYVYSSKAASDTSVTANSYKSQKVEVTVTETTITINDPTGDSFGVNTTFANKVITTSYDSRSTLAVPFTVSGTGGYNATGASIAWSIEAPSGAEALTNYFGSVTIPAGTSTTSATLTGAAGNVTKVGSTTFTVKAALQFSNNTVTTNEKTYTFKVVGDKPTITLASWNGTAGSGYTNLPDSTDIGAVYDITNKVYYVNKRVSWDASQQTADKSPVRFRIDTIGYGDTTVTAKFSGSGHGFSLAAPTAINTDLTTDGAGYTKYTANTTNNTKAGYVYVSLVGTAAKKGTYNLVLTAKNAAGTTTSKTYTFTVNDIPSITAVSSADRTVTWGEPFKLDVTAKNADSIAILAADTGDNSGVCVDSLPVGKATIAVGDFKAATGNNATDMSCAFADSHLSADQVTTTETTPGTRTFRISADWEAAAGSTNTVLPSSNTPTPTKTVKLIAKSGSGTGAVYTVYTLTFIFESGAPVITATSDLTALTYGTALTSAVAIATAKGVGYISWDVPAINAALPLGLTVDTANTTQASNTSTLKIKGTPYVMTPTAGSSVTLTARNYYEDTHNTKISDTDATGTQTIKIGSSLTAPALGDTENHKLPSGWVSKDQVLFTNINTNPTAASRASTVQNAYTMPDGNARFIKIHESDGVTRSPAAIEGEVELFAEPGPLTWSAKNLPENVQLVADANDTRYAYLQFKDATSSAASTKGFSGASTIKTTTTDDSTTYSAPYTITITNPYTTTKTTTISRDLIVWDKPSITSFSKNSMKIDADFESVVKAAGTPLYYYVEIVDSDDTNGVRTVNLLANNYTAKGGTEELAWNGNELKLSGKLDRLPLAYDASGKEFTGFKFTVRPENYAGAGVSKDFYVKVAGVKPKLDKAAETKLTDGGTAAEFTASTGTASISMDAYIKAADAKKIFGYAGETSVDLKVTTRAADVDRYGFSFIEDPSGAKGTLGFNNPSGKDYAFKNLPVTVTATNRAGSATTVYKITVESDDPTWSISGATLDDNDTIYVKAGTALEDDIVCTANVTDPYELKVSPMSKNGFTVTSADRVVTITGTPEKDKETKTTFTLTATNTSTKQKATKKFTIVGLVPPEIPDGLADKLSKEVILGKKISIAPKATGSKTISWDIASDSETTEAQLEALGLDFDSVKGTIKGTPNAATVDSGIYTPLNVTLEAHNYAIPGDNEWPTVAFKIGVKGAKTKVTTKKLTYNKGSTTDTLYVATNPSYSDASGMTFAMSGVTGITIDESTGALAFDESSLKAAKGDTAEVTVNNAGTEAKGKVKFTINDATPVINDVEIAPMTAQEKSKQQQQVTLSVTDETCTGDTKIKWSVTGASKSQAKIKSSGNGKTATLTITVPKNLKNTDDEDITEKLTITATNTRTKVAGTTTAEYTITPVSTATEATAEDATFDKTADATAKEKAATGEGEVKFGKTRTAPTAAQLGAIQKVLGDGYVIAAVLPEIEVTAEGQYDFEVDLDEKVAAGAELVWFAFPESGKETEDDEIVDFYTKAGEDTKVVPEDHVLVVSPWLNAEVKYEPVIAVKVDAAEAEAVDAESVKEAAEEQAAE